MGVLYGVDYAWDKPTIAWLKDNNYAFVCRYLSNDDSKDLSASEANLLAASGIWICVVWETSAQRAAQGHTAGIQDAAKAVAKTNALNKPSNRPIYFAVDFDASTGQVAEYFRGVNSVLGVQRTGVYAGYNVVKGLQAAGLATWFWQTSAWSNSKWFSMNHLEQFKYTDKWDLNRALRSDYGQWLPGRTPVDAPMEEITMDNKQLAVAVWRTDNVLNAPAGHQEGDNPYWAAQNFLREIYTQNEQIISNQTKILDNQGKILTALANVQTPGTSGTVDAKAVVDELARRLLPSPDTK